MLDENNNIIDSTLSIAIEDLLGKHDESKEEILIDEIARRVDLLLDQNHDLLMSYLYRLDVDENKIIKVFNTKSEVPISRGLAILIWNRQKARLQTKRNYRSKK